MTRVFIAVTLALLAQSIELRPEQALEIAKSIADYEGYTPSQARKVDIEIVDHPGEEFYGGYISLQILINTHPAHFFSIMTCPRKFPPV